MRHVATRTALPPGANTQKHRRRRKGADQETTLDDHDKEGEKENEDPAKEEAGDAEKEEKIGEVAPVGEQDEEARLEQLYESIAWPLADRYGHTYDAFKLALTCGPFILSPTLDSNPPIRDPLSVFGQLNIPEQTLNVLINTISRRLTPQPIKLRADIELTCYTSGRPLLCPSLYWVLIMSQVASTQSNVRSERARKSAQKRYLSKLVW